MKSLKCLPWTSGVLMSVALGCASSEPAEHVDRDGYRPSAAAALAYDPPVYLAMSPAEREELDGQLARFGRDESSLLGYDTPTVSTYYLRVDDRQRILGPSGGFGYYGGFGGFYGGYGGFGSYGDDYSRRAIVTESFERVRP